MRRMLTECPNCGGRLEATRLSCTNCETVILARYEPCPMCRLSEESMHFVEAFVKYRGNLKEMERALGQSYWALRNQLGDVIRELGFEDTERTALDDQQVATTRRVILDRLESGEMDAAEAARALGALRGSPGDRER